MDSLLQTRRIARPLSLLTTAVLIAYPLALLAMALTGSFNIAYLRDTYDLVALPEVFALPALIATYAIALVSVALTCAVLWNIRALLRLFSQGDVVGPETARIISRIGTLLLVLATYSVVAHTLTVLALTLGNPPGGRSLSVAVNSTDLFLFIAAGMMIVIGLAMSEAARIADENRAFV